MTPTGFFLQHRETVIALAANNTLSEAWRLLVQQIGIDSGMSENSFRGLLPPFLETSRYYDKQIELNNTVKQELEQVKHELNTLQELNNELNNQIELNSELNKSELNNPVKQSVKHGLNISGWTIAKSLGYYRAFKKVAGKQIGVYLGKTLDDAAEKIEAKEQSINFPRHTNTATDT